MAKIALVGYGHDGRGLGKTDNGYAYIVNDNVKTKDIIQPVATNWQSGKKFATTGQVRQTAKETSVKGTELKQRVESDIKSKDMLSGQKPEITKAYTGKELGVSGFRGSPEYQARTRGGNIAMEQQKNPYTQVSQNAEKYAQSYEDYVNQFKGEQ